MIYKKTNFILLVMLLASALVITGCSVKFNTNKNEGNNGGIYWSNSKGDIWQQKVLIPTTSGLPNSIGGVSVNDLVMDPSDNKALYLASFDNGLIYTYDGAGTWQIAKNLGQRTINAVAIDPNSKCIIYATTGNEVYKSTDCNRTWTRVYIDNNSTTAVSAVAVDHFDSAIIYIGTSRGEIIKSFDRVDTWQTLSSFKNKINKIIISPHDSRNLFVYIQGLGLERSSDGGNNWESLKENLKNFKNSANINDIIVSENTSGLIFLAAGGGLLKSSDNGNNWEEIKLITPSDSIINAMAVNPQNTQEIYYVTNTTFYRSLDGGENWKTIKMPTSAIGWKLLIDPKEPNIIYLGIKLPPKK